MTETTSRSDAYLLWRARLAAKQQAQRTPEEIEKPAPNPMWDPASLFESKAPGPSPDRPAAVSPAGPEPTPAAIDLRTPPIDLLAPLDEPPAPVRAADRAPQTATVSTRHRALVDRYARSRQQPEPEPAASVADALRELNEQRLAGTISEDEFKARKAEIFS